MGTSSAGTLFDQLPAAACDRPEWVVVNGNLRVVDVRNFLVEERRHQAHQSTFGLPFFAEEQHVVLGENCDVEFGNDGVVVADDAGIQLFAGLEFGEEVVVNFLLNRFGSPAAIAQLGKCGRPARNRSRHDEPFY